MSKAPAPARAAVFALTRDSFGLLNVLFLALAVANLILAMVTGSSDAYRLLPCWFLLLGITAACSVLADLKILVWILVVAACVGVEFLRYREYQWEILVRTGMVYAPLMGLMLILHSTRVDERKSGKDQAKARLDTLRQDTTEKLNLLKKMRSGELEKGATEQEEILKAKRATLELYRELFPPILRIRYKRDIPPLIQSAAQDGFGLGAGVVYEMPEDKAGEPHIRALWGLEKSTAIEELLRKHAKGDLVRVTAETRSPLQLDAIKRQPNLFEEHDQMAGKLFAPECLLPVLLLGKTLFVVVVGRPTTRGRAPYEFTLFHPLIQACGQAISKLAQKDGRASFSTFTPGS